MFLEKYGVALEVLLLHVNDKSFSLTRISFVPCMYDVFSCV